MNVEERKQRFEHIYLSEADAIFRYCLLRSDRESALDFTAEAFSRLWRSISAGKEIVSPRPFLFRIARNLVIDWYRKTKPQSLEEMMYGDESEDGDKFFEPTDYNAEAEVVLMAESRILLTALRKVRPQYREVLYLRFMEDLEPREIAETLDLSPGKVSVRITRGMEELRKILHIDLNK